MNKIENKSNIKKFSPFLCLIAILALMTNNAYANDAITNAICNVKGFITSGPGKAIVVIVIISTGFGMFFGKITWVTALIILVGVGLTFGADAIVGTIIGGSFVCTTGSL